MGNSIHQTKEHKSKNKNDKRLQPKEKSTSDFQGHYDLDGVSCQNGNIYVSSHWPSGENSRAAS